MWGRHTLNAGSHAQSVVGLSSAEAEYYAMTKEDQVGLGIRLLALDWGLHDDVEPEQWGTFKQNIFGCRIWCREMGWRWWKWPVRRTQPICSRKRQQPMRIIKQWRNLDTSTGPAVHICPRSLSILLPTLTEENIKWMKRSKDSHEDTSRKFGDLLLEICPWHEP